MVLQFFTFATAANANDTCQLIKERQIIISLLYAHTSLFCQNRTTKICIFICFVFTNCWSTLTSTGVLKLYSFPVGCEVGRRAHFHSPFIPYTLAHAHQLITTIFTITVLSLFRFAFLLSPYFPLFVCMPAT